MVKSRSKKNYEVLMSALVIKKQLSVLYYSMHIYLNRHSNKMKH